MREVKCSYCEEYRNEWCEKVIDSPHPDILRDCQYFHEAKTRWIPVTERLPEELAEVLVTWENTDPEAYYESIKGKHFTGAGIYYRGRWFWYSSVCADYLGEYGFSPTDSMDDAIKVLAWQPLPEPWKEGRDEQID